LKAFPNNPTSNKMSSAQSQTRQQEIEEYDTDKMPTIAEIDELYNLMPMPDSMRLTLDRVSNLLNRLAEDDISFPEPETDDDDDVMCVDCDYGMSRQAFERGKGRIMFGLNVKYLKRKEYRCGCCDDRVSDPQGEFPDTDSEEDEDDEPQHDICCGCGKYDDTRPVCDCGGSHRSNCAECEDKKKPTTTFFQNACAEMRSRGACEAEDCWCIHNDDYAGKE